MKRKLISSLVLSLMLGQASATGVPVGDGGNLAANIQQFIQLMIEYQKQLDQHETQQGIEEENEAIKENQIGKTEEIVKVIGQIELIKTADGDYIPRDLGKLMGVIHGVAGDIEGLPEDLKEQYDAIVAQGEELYNRLEDEELKEKYLKLAGRLTYQAEQLKQTTDRINASDEMIKQLGETDSLKSRDAIRGAIQVESNKALNELVRQTSISEQTRQTEEFSKAYRQMQYRVEEEAFLNSVDTSGLYATDGESEETEKDDGF